MRYEEFALNPETALFPAIEQNYNKRRAEREAIAAEQAEAAKKRAVCRRNAVLGCIVSVAAVGFFALGALVASWI